MITRIELNNFMSHRQTVIEPAAGLTVLVGPNNVGKSAVVAALQILCHNDKSTYVMRHGERECSVVVHTDDGHVVQWHRKKSVRYLIDGLECRTVRGGGLPDELHQALRLSKVDGLSDADFDIHFGTQKSPIFLLDGSAASAARFFASSSDAIRLVEMQKRHKDQHAEAKREKRRLEAESQQLNAELATLAPIVPLAGRLKVVEQIYTTLLEQVSLLAEAQDHLSDLRSQSLTLAQLKDTTTVLAKLAPPPVLMPTGPLQELANALERESIQWQTAQAKSIALAELREPPALADETTLQATINRLAAVQRESRLAAVRETALAALGSPPILESEAELLDLVSSLTRNSVLVKRYAATVNTLAAAGAPPVSLPTDDLQQMIRLLDAANSDLGDLKQQASAVDEELQAAGDELRAAAAEQVCPICGGDLDPDRVLQLAAAGLGGHDHE